MPLNTEQHVVTSFHPLTRSKDNRIIAGVCGGLGEYFQIDPVIFRLAFIVGVLALGMGILLYIILWIAVPSEK
ncbi:MAG: PspC domain-containing protein [Deltaproteobacteria bacterium]|nr:PspC domain-containing protein [Deltaproteobacteria bacterium]MBI3016833.1 PspC domain-containing protein [Deltaproteobacteria bacterium]